MTSSEAASLLGVIVLVQVNEQGLKIGDNRFFKMADHELEELDEEEDNVYELMIELRRSEPGN